MGEAWMRAVRASLPRPRVLRQPLGHQDADPSTYAPYGVYDGVQIGALHLYGMPLEQVKWVKTESAILVLILIVFTPPIVRALRSLRRGADWGAAPLRDATGAGKISEQNQSYEYYYS